MPSASRATNAAKSRTNIGPVSGTDVGGGDDDEFCVFILELEQRKKTTNGAKPVLPRARCLFPLRWLMHSNCLIGFPFYSPVRELCSLYSTLFAYYCSKLANYLERGVRRRLRTWSPFNSVCCVDDWPVVEAEDEPDARDEFGGTESTTCTAAPSNLPPSMRPST